MEMEMSPQAPALPCPDATACQDHCMQRDSGMRTQPFSLCNFPSSILF